jgi:hypothetical protein
MAGSENGSTTVLTVQTMLLIKQRAQSLLGIIIYQYIFPKLDSRQKQTQLNGYPPMDSHHRFTSAGIPSASGNSSLKHIERSGGEGRESP